MTKWVEAFFTKDKIAFSFFLIFGCVCGAVFRFDMEWWDFINYHYYNAWAFLNDRLNVDVIPAFINTFISPIIELPFYFLINALNDHPVIFSTIMAVPYGLLLFVTYKTVILFFPSNTGDKRLKAGLTLLLCIASPIVFMEVSGVSHEHIMSLMVLTGLYLLLKGFSGKGFNAKSLLLSGFILGMSTGLKWTYAPCAAASGLTLIFFYKRLNNPARSVLLFTCAGLTGFLIAYGYWGWILWKNFENPVFPFFNSIFQSPFWDNTHYKDVRYFNGSWLDTIFYPFTVFWEIGGDSSLHQRFLFSQIRLLAGLAIIFPTFISAIKKHISQKTNAPFPLLYVLTFWLICVYLLWLSFFRLYRYMIPFEILLSILLIHFLFGERTVLSCKKRLLGLILFLCYTAFECVTLPNTRLYDEPLLPASVTPLPDDTLLIITDVPAAMFIPFLAHNTTVRAVLSPEMTEEVNGSASYASGYFEKKRNKLISEHKRQKKPVAYIVKESSLCNPKAGLKADFYYYYSLVFKPDISKKDDPPNEAKKIKLKDVHFSGICR